MISSHARTKNSLRNWTWPILSGQLKLPAINSIISKTKWLFWKCRLCVWRWILLLATVLRRSPSLTWRGAKLCMGRPIFRRKTMLITCPKTTCTWPAPPKSAWLVIIWTKLLRKKICRCVMAVSRRVSDARRGVMARRGAGYTACINFIKLKCLSYVCRISRKKSTRNCLQSRKRLCKSSNSPTAWF